MSIPDYQSIMLPLLRLASDGETHLFRSAVEELANQFSLTPEERRELLPSGKQPTFDNRVGWARTYLTKAGLLSSPKRGKFLITELGQKILNKKPTRIDVKFLEQFDDFVKFKNFSKAKNENKISESSSNFKDLNNETTPEETLECAYQSIRTDLANEILDKIKRCSPAFFEDLVVDLIVKMGYGGSRKEAGQAIGRSGDEGIDGIIKEDRLGLDIIYIQAKRWESVVGRPEIQKFAGALQGQRSRKGIFITTSSFSREASEYVKNIDTKIILVDGAALAEYMIDNNVGVTVEVTYELKRIDSDYFSED